MVASRTLAVGAIEPDQAMAWSGIPLGYLSAVIIGMAMVLLSGLRLSVRSWEIKAPANVQRDRERWVYWPAV